MINYDGIRDYCENELREVQTDNLYFGKDRGSIYWVPGAEAWCYLCGEKTEWGQADELLAYMDDDILENYYWIHKEGIDEYIKEQE
jgi:hypothetical protein|tara:strand:- start:55 stop:312 length:258 start_codon:yes stop_codon:yes gene_type:complete